MIQYFAYILTVLCHVKSTYLCKRMFSLVISHQCSSRDENSYVCVALISDAPCLWSPDYQYVEKLELMLSCSIDTMSCVLLCFTMYKCTCSENSLNLFYSICCWLCCTSVQVGALLNDVFTIRSERTTRSAGFHSSPALTHLFQIIN